MRARALAIVHPLLISLFPLLLFAATNRGLFQLDELWTPLAAVLALCAVSGGIWWLLTRDLEKAALLTCLSQLVVLLHGHVHGALIKLGAPYSAIYPTLMLMWLAVLCLAWWKLRRETREFEQLSQCLAVVGAILVGFGLFQIARHYTKLAAREVPPRESVFRPEQLARNNRRANVEELPDIYYIILDAYGRGDQLVERCGYDNSAFLKGLEQRGFYIADNSHSNYATTFLSLASSLNLRYLDPEIESLGVDNVARGKFTILMQASDVARYLQAKGYTYVHLNTWSGTTNKSPIADVSLPHPPTEFKLRFLETTILRPYAWHAANLFDAQSRKLSGPNLLLAHFQALEEIPRNAAPTFTLAHIICPHPPYYFDRNGELVEQPVEGWTNHEADYVEQLIYVNRRVEKIVDTILAQPGPEPIILIQSDHGSSFLAEAAESDRKGNQALLDERMSILNCYYVPENCRRQLYDSITPVNSFRVVLGSVFGEQLPLLPDRAVFSWYDRPYDTADVTNRLRSNWQVADRPGEPARRQ